MFLVLNKVGRDRDPDVRSGFLYNVPHPGCGIVIGRNRDFGI